jgi:hypothetical protein
MFEHSEQASPISKDVTEIRITSHLARYQPGNMTHVSHEGTRVATFRDDYQKVELVGGWPKHYPNVTVKATKFMRPHKSRMRQYTTQCLLQQGQTDAVLNRQRQGATIFESTNMKIDHSQPSRLIFFTFL